METVQLVGEGDTVVGHFRCSGTPRLRTAAIGRRSARGARHGRPRCWRQCSRCTGSGPSCRRRGCRARAEYADECSPASPDPERAGHGDVLARWPAVGVPAG
ncbi:hypothetical protein [Blastococcus saxobsidens]